MKLWGPRKVKNEGCREYGNSHRNSHRTDMGVGMGRFFSLWIFPHVGILWEIVFPTCGNLMGNRHSHMWKSYGVIRAYFNVSGYNH